METIENSMIKRRISPSDTLRSLKIGESIEIKQSEIKMSVIKRAAVYLNSRGYTFRVSEAGRVDSVLVTRLK